MDDADPLGLRIAGPLKSHHLAIDSQLSIVRGDHSREDLHEGAFARSVLAADRVQLAWHHLKRDIVQGAGATEMLADMLNRDDRLGHD